MGLPRYSCSNISASLSAPALSQSQSLTPQSYLAQRLSVAIQRGNSASVMGTMDGDGEEFFV